MSLGQQRGREVTDDLLYDEGLDALIEASQPKSSTNWVTIQPRLNDIYWDGKLPPDQNRRCIQFLSENVITVKLHNFVVCKDGKRRSFVCRKSKPFNDSTCMVCEMTYHDDDDGKIKNYKPQDWTMAPAVEMKAEVTYIEKNNRKFPVTSYSDIYVEYTIPELLEVEKEGRASQEVQEYRSLLNALGKPGQTISIPNVGLVSQNPRSFWKAGIQYMAKYGLCDRVYEIARDGLFQNITYTWINEGPNEDFTSVEVLQEKYFKYPFEHPKAAIKRLGDLERMKYYLVDEPKNNTSTTTASVPTQRVVEEEEVVPVVSETTLSLKDRLLKSVGNE